jgi:hypothetical protein
MSMRTKVIGDEPVDPERPARLEALHGPTCTCGHRLVVHGRDRCLAVATVGERTDGKRVVSDCPCTGFQPA